MLNGNLWFQGQENIFPMPPWAGQVVGKVWKKVSNGWKNAEKKFPMVGKVERKSSNDWKKRFRDFHPPAPRLWRDKLLGIVEQTP